MRSLLKRAAWLLVMLLGVTFATFVVVDLAPVDRAELEVARTAPERVFTDAGSRAAAVLQLRVIHGMVDPVTFEPLPLWRRYGNWFADTVMLRFSGTEDMAAVWQRLGAAAPVTLLLGGLTLLLAFGLGIPLGAWLGMRVGSRAERVASTGFLIGAAVPEFLAATLLLLAFGSAWLQWLPIAGLSTPGSATWSLPARLLDLAVHLVLPLTAMALGPTVMVSRFVRDAVARASASPFVASMRALGIDERIVRRRLLRHGCVPAATLVGSLLPILTSGSIVIENLFAIDGLGHLAFAAATNHDQPTLMATVVIGSLVTLLALLLSDWLHHVVDSRVKWS